MALLGYARVSTADQDVRGQHNQLEGDGCRRIWTDTASGALASRPQLGALLGYADEGDTIVVTRLDRLGRSLPHLVATVTELGERELTRERTQAGLAAASDRGRPAGRPSVMTDERREMARQMLDSGYEVAQVARTIGVVRATIYRHLGR